MSNLFLRMPKLNPVDLMQGVTIAYNSSWDKKEKRRFSTKSKVIKSFETRGLEPLAAHFKDNQKAFNFALDAHVDWEIYTTIFCRATDGSTFCKYLPVFKKRTSFRMAHNFIESSVIPKVGKDFIEWGIHCMALS